MSNVRSVGAGESVGNVEEGRLPQEGWSVHTRMWWYQFDVSDSKGIVRSVARKTVDDGGSLHRESLMRQSRYNLLILRDRGYCDHGRKPNAC